MLIKEGSYRNILQQIISYLTLVKKDCVIQTGNDGLTMANATLTRNFNHDNIIKFAHIRVLKRSRIYWKMGAIFSIVKITINCLQYRYLKGKGTSKISDCHIKIKIFHISKSTWSHAKKRCKFKHNIVMIKVFWIK